MDPVLERARQRMWRSVVLLAGQLRRVLLYRQTRLYKVRAVT